MSDDFSFIFCFCSLYVCALVLKYNSSCCSVCVGMCWRYCGCGDVDECLVLSVIRTQHIETVFFYHFFFIIKIISWMSIYCDVRPIWAPRYMYNISGVLHPHEFILYKFITEIYQNIWYLHLHYKFVCSFFVSYWILNWWLEVYGDWYRDIVLKDQHNNELMNIYFLI